MKNNDIEKQLDEIAAMPAPKKRIWEIDFFRGLLILFVIFDHFLYDVMALSKFYTSQAMIDFGTFASEYRKGISDIGILRNLTHDTFVYLFVLLSGVSVSFSRNNFKRGLKMSAFAVGFTLVTLAISEILQMKLTVWFNVIHVIALCVLIFSLTEFLSRLCKRNWQKNIFGVVLFAIIVVSTVLGYYYIKNPVTEHNWTYIFVKYKLWSWIGADYWTLFPSLGWFFVGAFVGKFLYREKTTIFPSVNAKLLVPVTFIGRHSIWFYFASQIVMYGGLYFFAVILGIL